MLREAVRQSTKESDWATVDFAMNSENATQRRNFLQQQQQKGRSGSGYKEDVEAALSASQGWVSALIVGVILGFIAVEIIICNKFVDDMRQGVCAGYFWLNKESCCPGFEPPGSCDSWVPWGEYFGGPQARHNELVNFCFYVTVGAMFAMCGTVFCRFFAPFAAGGGINEVKTIVSGSAPMRRYFNGWTLFFKPICVILTTGSGLQTGKEGPFVHIGACASDLIGSFFPEFNDDGRRRELLAAGAGAGMAVAFGAPIGGVIFAIEEVTSLFSFRMMMQTLICGVTGVIVVKNFDVTRSGRIVQFAINYRFAWKWFELPLFALLGCFGGLVGAVWAKYNMMWCARRKTSRMKIYPITEIGILAVITCALNFFAPFCKGDLLALLAQLFQDCEPGSTLEVCNDNELQLVLFLILAAIIKSILSLFTVGAMVPCGVLVPMLVIGGLTGRAFGIMFRALQRTIPDSYFFSECAGSNLCVIPGAYAIVGSAAVLTGVTRMTICLVVIMFELTGALEYLVPVIISILVAKATGDALGIESIYELGIEAGELPYLDPKKEFTNPATAIDVAKAVRPHQDYIVLEAEGVTIAQLNNILEHFVFMGFPVVQTTMVHSGSSSPAPPPPPDVAGASGDGGGGGASGTASAPTGPTAVAHSTLLGYISRKALVMALQETAIAHSKYPTEITVNSTVRFTEALPGASEIEKLLDFSRYVDSSSIQVPPECSSARLLYLFKSLGLRHVLVTSLSRFVAVVTKKDFIKFMRDVEHEEDAMMEQALHALHKQQEENGLNPSSSSSHRRKNGKKNTGSGNIIASLWAKVFLWWHNDDG